MTEIPYSGLLFDLDGTLVMSLDAVTRAWRTWAVEFGLDPDYVAPRIHGRRAVDSIAALAPHLDQTKAFLRLEHLEATDTDGVIAIDGARRFLDSLEPNTWGIVTSGSLAIAVPRLRAGGIQQPCVFVTADDVMEGKPNPAPFLEGAKRLGVEPSSIVAFEDTLAGVRAAHAANMRVVGVGSEARVESDYSISNYIGIRSQPSVDSERILVLP